MNKTIRNLALSTLVATVASTLQAGVPLNNLQGSGGIAFNPLAYTSGQDWEGTTTSNLNGYVSKPQVGGWYANLSDADIHWFAASASATVLKRLELSYGYGFVLSVQYQF